MKPKEKAHELFEKMAQHLCNTDAQECAIIAVDEILHNDGFTQFDQYLTEYWQEVKQELEQILEGGFFRGV